jgi:hypothetical protein
VAVGRPAVGNRILRHRQRLWVTPISEASRCPRLGLMLFVSGVLVPCHLSLRCSARAWRASRGSQAVLRRRAKARRAEGGTPYPNLARSLATAAAACICSVTSAWGLAVRHRLAALHSHPQRRSLRWRWTQGHPGGLPDRTRANGVTGAPRARLARFQEGRPCSRIAPRSTAPGRAFASVAEAEIKVTLDVVVTGGSVRPIPRGDWGWLWCWRFATYTDGSAAHLEILQAILIRRGEPFELRNGGRAEVLC